MAIYDTWTQAEAEEMLAKWKEAEKLLADGTVSSYKIGSRELTMVDIGTIQSRIQYFSNIIDIKKNNVNTRTVRRVVFRDT